MNTLVSLRSSFVFVGLLAITGCLYKSDTQLISPDDRATPLKVGSYYQTTKLKPSSSMERNWQEKFTKKELELISAGVFAPNYEKEGDLRKEDDCYYFAVPSEEDSSGFFFQHIKGDVYLYEATDRSCSNQAKQVKDGFTCVFMKVDRHGRIYLLTHPKNDVFPDWLEKLNQSEKEDFDVPYSNELTNTEALLEFYKEYQEEFDRELMLVPVGKAKIYKEEMGIAARLKRLSKS